MAQDSSGAIMSYGALLQATIGKRNHEAPKFPPYRGDGRGITARLVALRPKKS